MKKLVLLITALGYFASSYAQQFSFQMFFTDAVGNKDTITLGYDSTATDSIDALFGEVNIISNPLNNNLDVRITNSWNDASTPIYFHTKKQITFYDCTYTNFSVQAINIFTNHWPVTVEWEHSLFSDTCRNGSVFTSIHPGGWWDTGSPSDLFRAALSSATSPITFTSNFSLTSYGYINANGDSIAVFWQAFGDAGLLYNSISENEFNHEIKLFPNPSASIFNFEISNQFGQLKKMEIYSSIGKLIFKSDNPFVIDLTSFEKGIYMVVLTNDKGEKLKTIAVKV